MYADRVSAAAPNAPINPDASPLRVLGLFDATCIVIGAIIGVGIFISPSGVARLTGTESLALVAWGLAGGIALCGALAMAELGGMYHESGAQYQILRDSSGSLPAFLFVFCNGTAIQPGTMGIIAVVCANNLAVAAGRSEPQGWLLMAIASALILALAVANIVGVRWGSRVQNLTVLTKVIALLAVTVLAVFLAPDRAEVAAASTAPASASALNPLQGLLAALIPALFAYGGWQQALWIAGEVREPARNLPRAIVGGVVIVIAVYLLANWSYLRLLGAPGVAESRAVAADAVSVVMPDLGRRLIAAAVAVSAFGVLNAQLLAGPRLIFGMACDGRFFRPFANLHPRLGTPTAAIALLTIMSLLILGAALASGSTRPIDQLLNGTMFIDVTFFALTGIALIVLRRTRPDAARPVRVPGYPIVPLLFVLGELGALVGSMLNPEVRGAAIIGAIWIAAAALVYGLWFRNAASDQRIV